MDNHHLRSDRTYLVASLCLLLAGTYQKWKKKSVVKIIFSSAKFEETSSTIPKIDELNSFVNNCYFRDDFKQTELIILNFFQYYLIFPTAAHYTFHYMQVIISYDDLIDDTRNFRTLFYELRDWAVIYLDRIIDDVHYMQNYKPSMLAAAVTAASRLDAKLSFWTKQLENMTEYTEQELAELVGLLRLLSILCELSPFTIFFLGADR